LPYLHTTNVNGVEPHANKPMYLLDKAFAWTGLWMMVVSPFAGNLLSLLSTYEKWSDGPILISSRRL
jgi:hypothetical protein